MTGSDGGGSGGRSVGRRIAELTLEAMLIVFAVIIALAVDQYWESHEEVELAETALLSIRSEIERNHEQLLDNREDNRSSARHTQTILQSIREGATDVPPALVDYSFSLIGDDAWQTAQATRAIHFMDFSLVTQISQIYRIQEFFTARQDRVVDAVASFMEGQAAGSETVGGYSTQLLISLQIECQLMTSYEMLLARLDGGPDFDVEALEDAVGGRCSTAWLNEPPADAEAPTGGR